MQGENFLSHKLRISRIFGKLSFSSPKHPLRGMEFSNVGLCADGVLYAFCVCMSWNAFSRGATKMLSDNVSRAGGGRERNFDNLAALGVTFVLMSRRHMLLSNSPANLQCHFEARRKLVLSSKMPEAPLKMGYGSGEGSQSTAKKITFRRLCGQDRVNMGSPGVAGVEKKGGFLVPKNTGFLLPSGPTVPNKKLERCDKPRGDFDFQVENILLCCLQKEDGSGLVLEKWFPELGRDEIER
ncbi:hypothetical protein CDAR_434451 [Caerostris darwini]|uniref:Uncharacterized protein n=1 Tax=Caerostris darwini TaxID=1538125 RepID=A0AAV4PKT8_9ARAC|nr:hypothetical protein CDAR_434451 [Caerostris darwini]